MFNLIVRGTKIASGSRAELLDFVDWYYERRAGYKKVAHHHWERGTSTVQIKRNYKQHGKHQKAVRNNPE